MKFEFDVSQSIKMAQTGPEWPKLARVYIANQILGQHDAGSKMAQNDACLYRSQSDWATFTDQSDFENFEIDPTL